MLDTHARHVVQPIFDTLAQICARKGIGPLQVTLSAAALGAMAAGTLAMGWTAAFLFLLWLSGLLDAVDGTLARQEGSASRAGALLDIVCDRLVEVLVIVAFGLRFPDALFALLLLSGSIILSLTVFLTSAAALPATSSKSFHYQAGLAERSEGFLFFSLMALWPHGVGEVALVFALVVFFTAGQRLRAALVFFRD
jgi:archaetidylinositol phosphate synthase